jgi:REP element-mobilizing transposase RayT
MGVNIVAETLHGVGALRATPLHTAPPSRHAIFKQRRTLRLKGYDYSQAGAYFITLCTQNRACLFGNVVDGQMRLNAMGFIVAEEWRKTAEIRKEMELGEWVVMPNHFHGILVITNPRRNIACCRGVARNAPTSRMSEISPKPGSIPATVRAFKSAVSKRISELQGVPGTSVWQRNYYEHFIRNDESLNHIRQYIFDNPAQWATDSENPSLHGCYTA